MRVLNIDKHKRRDDSGDSSLLRSVSGLEVQHQERVFAWVPFLETSRGLPCETGCWARWLLVWSCTLRIASGLQCLQAVCVPLFLNGSVAEGEPPRCFSSCFQGLKQSGASAPSLWSAARLLKALNPLRHRRCCSPRFRDARLGGLA